MSFDASLPIKETQRRKFIPKRFRKQNALCERNISISLKNKLAKMRFTIKTSNYDKSLPNLVVVHVIRRQI
ncbi:UNVERIFIED_CONTAM: hypothetical protein NCL1_25655 [Trichonephila clavipes]